MNDVNEMKMKYLNSVILAMVFENLVCLHLPPGDKNVPS